MAKKGQATRRQRFLPYRYERFGLAMNLVRCTLDGKREIEAFNAERHLVDVSDFRFETIELAVRVEVSKVLLGTVLPPSDRDRPASKLLLVGRCPTTYTRRRLGIEHLISAPGALDFEATFRRRDLLGSVELVPFLVRREARDDVEGYASSPGARLASARPWELRLDRLRSPSGAYLDIRFVSFAGQGAPAFPWPESLFQLDAERESPILWLNLDHSQVCEVLNNNANVGTRARARDVLFDYLSHTVWSRLFHKAAVDLQTAGDVPFEWEDNVLRQFLPALYPDEANHESRRAALERDLEGSEQMVLLQRLDAVLQARLEVPKHMKRLAEAGE